MARWARIFFFYSKSKDCGYSIHHICIHSLVPSVKKINIGNPGIQVNYWGGGGGGGYTIKLHSSSEYESLLPFDQPSQKQEVGLETATSIQSLKL